MGSFGVFCDCHLSPSTTSSRSIYAVTCVSLHSFIDEWHSIVRMDRVLFIRSLVDGCLDCSYLFLLEILYLWTLVYCSCVDRYFHFSGVCASEGNCAVHGVTMSDTHTIWLQKPQVSDSTAAAPFYVPTSPGWGLSFSSPVSTVTLVGLKDWLTLVLICISLVAGHGTPWPFLYIHWMHVYSGPLPVF